MSSKCFVCTDPDSSENPIVVCTECAVGVHILCYGVESNINNWKCSPCISEVKDSLCKLCMRKGGAQKKTTDGEWAHVICGLFTDGVIFKDNDRMEPIDLSKVSETKRNQNCMFCFGKLGYCTLCYAKKCKNRMHITCAQDDECLKEEHKSDGSIKFRAYCLDHKPVSDRRISSMFIREKLICKRKKKDMVSKQKNTKAKSAMMNTLWLIPKPTENEVIKPNSQSEKHVNEKRLNSTEIGETSVISVPKHPETATTDRSLWWDPADYCEVSQNQTSLNNDNFGNITSLIKEIKKVDDDDNKENICIENHVCFKDGKITKVCNNI